MLWQYIRERMTENPNQIVMESGAVMRYDDLIAFAEIFSKKIKGQKCCAIYCKSEMATAMAILSCIAAKVTAVPLSERYGENHCRKILDFINPSAIISDMGGELNVYKVKDNTYIEPEKKPAFIMCTSGTTGTPKGVMLSEQNILSNLMDIERYFDINASDSILIPRPIYHCAVLTGEYLLALSKGARITFCSEKFNPLNFIKIIEKQKITTMCATPTLFDIMSRFVKNADGIPLKNITLSGERLNEVTAKAIRKAFPNAKIYHAYGLTEASPRVAYLAPEYFDKHPEVIGNCLDSVKIRIISSNGTPAKIGQYGVLWVKGKNVMLGYYNNEELTKKTIVGKWLCTGDICRINEDGMLEIRGRADEMIIRAGMNVYPQEIEAELKKDNRTQEVLVYGYKDERYGTQIGMKIVGDFSDEREVRELCVEILPPHQVPAKIEIVDELEKNATGKVVRGGKFN